MRVAVVVLVVAAGACGRIGFDDRQIDLAVAPTFPQAGTNWNDYVGAGTDAACDVTATPYTACVHGGERRTVIAYGADSCARLALSDALGAFDWTCSVVDRTATFTSTLKPAKGLRDLVTAAGWLPESVTLAGSGAATTEPAVWWTNPVVELSDNTGTGRAVLDVPGTVYTLSRSRATDGYDITADRVSVVTLGTTELTANAGSDPVLGATDHDQLWIEAAIDARGMHDGMLIANGRFDEVRGTTVAGGGAGGPYGAGIVIDGIRSSRFQRVTSIDSAFYGILAGRNTSTDDSYFVDLGISGSERQGLYVHYASRDVFDGVTAAHANSDGLTIGPYCDGGGAANNTFARVRTFANAGNGIYVNSVGEHLVDVLAVGNGGNALALTSNCGYPHGLSVVDAVFAFHSGSGILAGEHHMTFDNVVAVGNLAFGIDVGGANTWSNLAVSTSTQGDIRLTADSTFAANLLVTSNASCTNPTGYMGLADATCTPTGASSATLFYQGSLAPDFVGATSATATFPTGAGFDWLGVGAYGVWGVWGGRWTAGTGSVLDFRLRATGSLVFDNITDVASRNAAFVPGATCPTAVDGARAVNNHNGGYNGFPDQIYLTAAVEIVSPASPGYGPGNHDGLCESGEHCLYTPNFGAYQGEGLLTTCTFVDGIVTGVTMYGFASNGV